MKIIKRGLIFLTLIFILSVLQIGASFALPYPFSIINTLFISLILILFVTHSGTIVWIAFFTHLIVELYSAAFPYGIILISATLSTLFVFWLYQDYIAVKSWPGLLLLTVISLIVYRAIFLTLLAITANFITVLSVQWRVLLVHLGLELALTSCFAMPFIIFAYYRSKARLSVIN